MYIIPDTVMITHSSCLLSNLVSLHAFSSEKWAIATCMKRSTTLYFMSDNYAMHPLLVIKYQSGHAFWLKP